MGNYNSQYESYYARLSGRRPYSSYDNNLYRYNSNKNTRNISGRGYLTGRFMRELTGVFCLLLVVIICKLIITPETKAVYSYSKEMVNTNMNYTILLDKVKGVNYNNIQSYVENVIVNMQQKVSGWQNSKNEIEGSETQQVNSENISFLGKSKRNRANEYINSSFF